MWRGVAPMAPRIPAVDRFWSKVVEAPADECWLWVGQRNGHGYGSFWDGTRLVRAHRWSYEFMRAEIIPFNLQIDHLCNVRNCVNPYHLEPVTWGVNAQRAVQRGRKFGANIALHGDRYAPRPLQSQSPVYRRLADALAAEIDSGARAPGSLIKYPPWGGSTINPDRSAIELLELWGMVTRLPLPGRPAEYASAVVLGPGQQSKGVFVAAHPSGVSAD